MYLTFNSRRSHSLSSTMGSSSSKVARASASAARRKYPSTPTMLNSGTVPSPDTAPIKPTPAVSVRPPVAAAPPTSEKVEHVELDARDPDFGSALRQLGAARSITERKPNEEYFPTSSQPMHSGPNIFPSQKDNPAVMLVQARRRIARQVEEELEDQGRPSFKGRTLVSAQEIRQALSLRDEGGKDAQEVEKQMRMRPGILEQLVGKGVVANV